MFKLFTVVVAILYWWWAVATPALAAPCYYLNNNQICLEKIKRSAKNYWEYRIVVSVDGVKQPQATYNCRSRTKIKSDRTVEDFQPNGFGEFICSKFKQ